MDGDAAGARLLHGALECDAAGTEFMHSLGLVLAAAIVTRLTEAQGVEGCCRFAVAAERRVRIGVTFAAKYFALLCTCAFEVFEIPTNGCIFRS